MKIFECQYFGFWIEFYWVANPIHIQWLMKIFECQYFGLNPIGLPTQYIYSGW